MNDIVPVTKIASDKRMDETPLEVIRVNEQEVREEYRDEDRHRKKETEKAETQKKCCMWVVRGGEEMHPVHLYNFKWTRSGNVMPNRNLD